VSFPALTLALGYLPTRPLVAVAVGVVTLLLGAALDESHRAAPGRRLQTAASAAAAWAVAMLPLPILIVFGVYGTSILGNAIPFMGEVPAHLFGLICSGAVAGLTLGAIAEAERRLCHSLSES
jgi:hypothetical protein